MHARSSDWGGCWAYPVEILAGVCKSNWLHVDDILRFSCIKLGVYSSIDSYKVIGNSPAVLNFNRLFFKLNRCICNVLPVLPDHRLWGSRSSLLQRATISSMFWLNDLALDFYMLGFGRFYIVSWIWGFNGEWLLQPKSRNPREIAATLERKLFPRICQYFFSFIYLFIYFSTVEFGKDLCKLFLELNATRLVAPKHQCHPNAKYEIGLMLFHKIGNFLEVLSFNQLFLKLNHLICNYTK